MHVYDNDVIGTTIPFVWLNGGAHYRQMKGRFTPTLSMLVLRQCLIMGSVSDNWAGVDSPHTSADAFLSVSLRVRHSSSPSSGWRDVSRHVFQLELYTGRNLTGLSCVSAAHCLSDITELERGRSKWPERVEREREGKRKNREERETQRGVQYPPWIHMHTKETLGIQQKSFLLFTRNRYHIL